jgi:phage shock protein E
VQKYLYNLFLLNLFFSFHLTADFIIDVRTLDEYRSGHLEDSINIEWQKISSIEQSIAKDEKLYLYCRSGNRSGKAADILISIGYKDLINLGSVESAAEQLNRNIVKKNQ